MPTQITLLAQGVAATICVGVQLVAWIALGAPLARRLRSPDLSPAVALLAGAAVTSFVYALLTLSGHVTTAIVVGVLLSVAALARGGTGALRRLRRLLTAYAELAERRAATVALALAGLALWLLAITPPRDADVMRYHLAHIRQIVTDGRWTAIPDYHYALPFGWSLNFLPFVRIGLPVAANLLSLALTVVTVALLLRLCRELGRAALIVVVLAVLLVLQPMALKVATTAHVDAYVILVSATVSGLLLLLVRGDSTAVLPLSFVALIGLQSRYQSIAVALAAGAVVLLRRAAAADAAVGATAALALAAPFYLVNWFAFGDPVWPLLAGDRTYADRVVSGYSAALDGPHDVTTYESGLRALFTDSLLAPVPIVVAGTLAGLLLVPGVRRRVPGLLPFVLGFCVLWAAVQPRLYSRFILFVAPPVAIALVALLRRPTARLPSLLAAVVLLPFLAFDAYYARDAGRLLVTGDLAAYHRYTWYYPVYTWIDDHTPHDARLLVIVRSAQTYYLDRRYRRADPQLSGVVDWERVHSPADLVRVLRSGGYRYVVYDDTDWSGDPGGAELERAIAAARAGRVLVPVRRFSIRLYESRVRRTSVGAEVWLLRLRTPVHSFSRVLSTSTRV